MNYRAGGRPDFGGRSLAKLMAFVDGGYLRNNFERKCNSTSINFEVLKNQFVSNFNANCQGKYEGDIFRVYYYDAAVRPSDEKFKEQEEFFSKIRIINGFDIRLGRLTSTGNQGKGPLKQKGVDVRLAVDMISKAYQNDYDFAILLAGDDDFLDVVEEVKDAGKRVYGMYFRDHISKDLQNSFDARIEIDNFVNSLKLE